MGASYILERALWMLQSLLRSPVLSMCLFRVLARIPIPYVYDPCCLCPAVQRWHELVCYAVTCRVYEEGFPLYNYVSWYQNPNFCVRGRVDIVVQVEHALPEQFLNSFRDGQFTTTPVSHSRGWSIWSRSVTYYLCFQENGAWESTAQLLVLYLHDVSVVKTKLGVHHKQYYFSCADNSVQFHEPTQLTVSSCSCFLTALVLFSGVPKTPREVD